MPSVDRFVFNSVVCTHAPKCTLGPSIKNLLETGLVDYMLVLTFVYYWHDDDYFKICYYKLLIPND